MKFQELANMWVILGGGNVKINVKIINEEGPQNVLQAPSGTGRWEMDKADYLLVKLSALVYNIFSSFGLGCYKLLIILIDLHQVLDDPNSN